MDTHFATTSDLSDAPASRNDHHNTLHNILPGLLNPLALSTYNGHTLYRHKTTIDHHLPLDIPDDHPPVPPRQSGQPERTLSSIPMLMPLTKHRIRQEIIDWK